MFDWGASFRCVGRLACVTEFGHLIYVFIKSYSTGIYSVCGGREIKKKKKKREKEQVQCPSYAEVLAVGSRRDTWQRKATSWHWGAWRRPSTSSLKWLCPRTWTGCRDTAVTSWRWRPIHSLTSHLWLLPCRWVTDRFCLLSSVPAQPAMGASSPGADQRQQDRPGKRLSNFFDSLIKCMAAMACGREIAFCVMSRFISSLILRLCFFFVFFCNLSAQ